MYICIIVLTWKQSLRPLHPTASTIDQWWMHSTTVPHVKVISGWDILVCIKLALWSLAGCSSSSPWGSARCDCKSRTPDVSIVSYTRTKWWLYSVQVGILHSLLNLCCHCHRSRLTWDWSEGQWSTGTPAGCIPAWPRNPNLPSA